MIKNWEEEEAQMAPDDEEGTGTFHKIALFLGIPFLINFINWASKTSLRLMARFQNK